MATTGVVKSQLLKIYTGATAITCLTNASVSMSTEMRDTTCKDSGDWTDNLPGTRTWSMSGDAYYSFDGANGASALFSAWTGGTLTMLVYQTAVTGDKKYTGSGYITSLEFTSPGGTNENCTFSFEFQGAGALSEGTVS